MEVAYGPLVTELERRLEAAGVSLPRAPRAGRAARPQAIYKRALLDAALARFGPRFLEGLGRQIAGYAGHPFISALGGAGTPERMILRWERLEVLAHSDNRVRTLSVDRCAIRLIRTRLSGGAPSLAEDTLILGILAGLLESLGAKPVRSHAEEAGDVGRSGRTWELRWTTWAPPQTAPRVEPWGISSDFARAAFALLVEETTLPLPVIAERLCVSPRSLQRRLLEAGTTFRSLSRSARVALAGRSLARGEPTSSSLTSVAYACGFADSAHFSREFRSFVGVQPKRFVRALRAS
jgi:AraC-like DNA-binding protein